MGNVSIEPSAAQAQVKSPSSPRKSLPPRIADWLLVATVLFFFVFLPVLIASLPHILAEKPDLRVQVTNPAKLETKPFVRALRQAGFTPVGSLAKDAPFSFDMSEMPQKRVNALETWSGPKGERRHVVNLVFRSNLNRDTKPYSELDLPGLQMTQIQYSGMVQPHGEIASVAQKFGEYLSPVIDRYVKEYANLP